MQALADSYFARYRNIIWIGSRGFSGKSLTLATLSFLEGIYLGAAVCVLGGSGEQAERVHDYMVGDNTNLPNTFWKHPSAPKHLLASDLTKRETKLTNGGRLKVIMASQRSVRGEHPPRLRIDEADELELAVYDGAMGQPMMSRGIPVQITVSSTHHHADGTVTELLRRAAEKGHKVYKWCWRCVLESNGGWLSQAEVDAKKNEVTEDAWRSEYDLFEPNPGSRAIMPDRVEAMFKRNLGVFQGESGETVTIEPPVEGGRYATGADWAKSINRTIIITIRTDVTPKRIVCYACMHRLPWPTMIDAFIRQRTMYPGAAGHDGTGLGTVVSDLLTEKNCQAFNFVLQGKLRYHILSSYIAAIEHHRLEAPFIQRMYNEHKRAGRDDVYGSDEHLPDTICAGAIAWILGDSGVWTMGMSS